MPALCRRSEPSIGSVVKLFQIEEPDGSPVDPDAPGVAIGIDISGAEAEIAVAVGGNAAVLSDREEFALNPTNALDTSTFLGQDVNARERMANEFARALVSAILEAF